MIVRAMAQRTPADTNHTGKFLQKRTRSTTAIIAFVVLAFGWSWAVGFTGARIKGEFPVLSMVLMMLAGFGPSLAGLAAVSVFSDPAGLRTWITRCLNWRVGWRWFVLAFLAPPIVMAGALAMDLALGGKLPSFSVAGHVPLTIANFGLVLLIGGPLGEEFGWRGYLMPALTTRMNWRAASLVIGVIWGLWHLPLFFMVGTAQAQMPIPVFMLNILAGSVLFGWLFGRTRGSVLPALVLHTSLNAWAGILVIVPTAATGRPYLLVTGLLALIALGLLRLPDRKSAPEVAR